jgi:elongation factor G
MIAADPSLRVTTDADTGQTLLAGMGQLHLDIAVERLAGEHGVTVASGRPRVAYRSTLAGAATHTYRHVKQSGGPGQFAVVTIAVGPAPRDAGLVFTDQTRGGAVPRPFAAAVERGVRDAMADGLAGGHPVVDVAVTLHDGETHAKDSSELAFQLAGRAAFHAAAIGRGRRSCSSRSCGSRSPAATATSARWSAMSVGGAAPWPASTSAATRASCAPSCRWPSRSATPARCRR